MKLGSKVWIRLPMIILMIAIMFSGCGSSNKSEVSYDSTGSTSFLGGPVQDIATEESAVRDSAIEAEESGITSLQGSSIENSVGAGRKLIKDVNLNVETKIFDDFITDISDRVEALGGYIENSEISGNSYNSESNRYATIITRIPSDSLGDFINQVEELSNVTYSQESVKDVTLQYVDMESHKKALLIEQERLLTLMENAEKVEDIIAIETRLSQVRYELEYYETQLRTYDNMIDYSTVTIMIQEVERISSVQKDNMWDKIRSGFLENIYNVFDGFNAFIIWLLTSIPYILVWGIIIVILVLVSRVIYKKMDLNKNLDKNKKNKNDKKEEQ